MGDSEQNNEDRVKVFPVQLTSWIEGQPDLAYLVEAANNTPALYKTGSDNLKVAPQREDIVNKKYSSTSAKIREFVWPSARSMRGDCFGTKTFDETCARAANTMAGSTIWDAVSTVPFVQFALINYLKFASLPVAFIISIGLMVLSNVAGRTGANRAKGRGAIANYGLAFFILLSLVKTLLSGVGFDILVNKDGITKEYAQQVLSEQIEKKQATLEELQALKNPKLINLQSACQPLLDKLDRINRDLQPQEHNTTWVMAFGTWEQKQSMVGLSNDALIKKFGGVSGIPGVCNQAGAQLALDLKDAGKMRENISSTQNKLGDETALNILQSDFPKVFSNEFKITEDGVVEIRSGQEVVGQAFTQFFNKIQDPERIFELGVSLFWMGVSIILSVMATILLWALSTTKEMKMSYNTKLLRYRMDLLQSYQDNLPLALKLRRERRAQEQKNGGES